MARSSPTNSVAKALAVLVLASMACGCMASREWRFGFNYTDWQLKHRAWWSRHHHHPNATASQPLPSKVIVGGSEHWRFNFSYINWTFNHGPFYLNDILVFKYEAPAGPEAHPHSVYLLPDYKSFVNCDLSNAKPLANATQGAGEGFEFALEKWQPYYFACGESNGFHCNVGRMKFSVMPLVRPWHT